MTDTEDTPRECFDCGTQFTGMGVQLFIALRESTMDYDARGRTTGFTNEVLCVECGSNGANYWPRDRYEARTAQRAAVRQLRRELAAPVDGEPGTAALVHHTADGTYTLAGLDGFDMTIADNGRVRIAMRDRSVDPATAALVARILKRDRGSH